MWPQIRKGCIWRGGVSRSGRRPTRFVATMVRSAPAASSRAASGARNGQVLGRDAKVAMRSPPLLGSQSLLGLGDAARRRAQSAPPPSTAGSRAGKKLAAPRVVGGTAGGGPAPSSRSSRLATAGASSGAVTASASTSNAAALKKEKKARSKSTAVADSAAGVLSSRQQLVVNLPTSLLDSPGPEDAALVHRALGEQCRGRVQAWEQPISHRVVRSSAMDASPELEVMSIKEGPAPVRRALTRKGVTVLKSRDDHVAGPRQGRDGRVAMVPSTSPRENRQVPSQPPTGSPPTPPKVKQDDWGVKKGVGSGSERRQQAPIPRLPRGTGRLDTPTRRSAMQEDVTRAAAKPLRSAAGVSRSILLPGSIPRTSPSPPAVTGCREFLGGRGDHARDGQQERGREFLGGRGDHACDGQQERGNSHAGRRAGDAGTGEGRMTHAIGVGDYNGEGEGGGGWQGEGEVEREEGGRLKWLCGENDGGSSWKDPGGYPVGADAWLAELSRLREEHRCAMDEFEASLRREMEERIAEQLRESKERVQEMERRAEQAQAEAGRERAARERLEREVTEGHERERRGREEVRRLRERLAVSMPLGVRAAGDCYDDDVEDDDVRVGGMDTREESKKNPRRQQQQQQQQQGGEAVMRAEARGEPPQPSNAQRVAQPVDVGATGRKHCQGAQVDNERAQDHVDEEVEHVGAEGRRVPSVGGMLPVGVHAVGVQGTCGRLRKANQSSWWERMPERSASADAGVSLFDVSTEDSLLSLMDREGDESCMAGALMTVGLDSDSFELTAGGDGDDDGVEGDLSSYLGPSLGDPELDQEGEGGGAVGGDSGVRSASFVDGQNNPTLSPVLEETGSDEASPISRLSHVSRCAVDGSAISDAVEGEREEAGRSGAGGKAGGCDGFLVSDTITGIRESASSEGDSLNSTADDIVAHIASFLSSRVVREGGGGGAKSDGDRKLGGGWSRSVLAL